MHPFNWVEDPLTLALSGLANYTLREPRRPDPIRLKADGTRFLNNPRDNLVTMIAVTSGEEGFTDSNNNGQFDQGEFFDDLTEPFVDSNDSGTWEDNERFIDVNGNRKWDGKNGQWDSNTLIWRQERLLWTGVPATEDTLATVPGVAGHKPVYSKASPAVLALTCPGSGPQCAAAGPPATVTAFIADPWFNSIAQNGDSDKCDIEASDNSPVKVLSPSSSGGFAFTYPAGRFYVFTVMDARDPQAPPIEQVARRSPAISFRAFINCSYTSSPKDGYVQRINRSEDVV
jgi:hypothetical protein